MLNYKVTRRLKLEGSIVSWSLTFSLGMARVIYRAFELFFMRGFHRQQRLVFLLIKKFGGRLVHPQIHLHDHMCSFPPFFHIDRFEWLCALFFFFFIIFLAYLSMAKKLSHFGREVDLVYISEQGLILKESSEPDLGEVGLIVWIIFKV